LDADPRLESLGYFQKSLRDTPKSEMLPRALKQKRAINIVPPPLPIVGKINASGPIWRHRQT